MQLQKIVDAHERTDLLRFLTAGSVDDGKSTLIGRLLHDSKLVLEDQLAAARKASEARSSSEEGVDLSLLMDGLRAGRIWVDHGGLLDACDVRVEGGGSAGLGGTMIVRKGTKATVTISITPATQPNWACFVPKLARVDAIIGEVTGPAKDADVFTAPGTRVAKSWDVTKYGPGEAFTLTLTLPEVAERGCYVRFRGSDGKRLAAGPMGAKVDPAGPAIDVMGKANPWDDLWFYTNPIWVLPRA